MRARNQAVRNWRPTVLLLVIGSLVLINALRDSNRGPRSVTGPFDRLVADDPREPGSSTHAESPDSTTEVETDLAPPRVALNEKSEFGVVEVIPRPAAQPWGPFVIHLVVADGASVASGAYPDPARFADIELPVSMVEVSRDGWVTSARKIAPESTTRSFEIPVVPRLAVEGLVLQAEDGQPVTEFTVRLEARVSRPFGTQTVVSSGAQFNSESGSFVVAEETADVTAERVTITARGRIAARSDWSPVQGSRVIFSPILLSKCDDCTISGTVLSESGKPIAGARLFISPGSATPKVYRTARDFVVRITHPLDELEEGMIDEDGGPVIEATTSPNGSFELFVPCGIQARLIAAAPEYVTFIGNSETLAMSEGRTHRVVLTAAVPTPIELLLGEHAQRTVQVDRVVVRQAGESIEAKVIHESVGPPSVTTLEAFISPLAGGSIEVYGRRIGRAADTAASIPLATTEFVQGGSTPIVVSIGVDYGAASISVRFLLPSGLHPELCLVGAFDSASGVQKSQALVADDGTVEIHELDAGEYELVFLGYADRARTPLLWKMPLSVSAKNSKALGIIDLSNASRIEILDCPTDVWRVTSDTGSVSPLAEELLVRTNADGSITILGLPAGRYFAEPMQGGGRWTFDRDSSEQQSTNLTPL
jgi:hypothetical protein